jgi:hypothetical protein
VSGAVSGVRGGPAIGALLARAEAAARERGAGEVGSLDLVLAIVVGGEGAAARLLEKSGASAEKLLEVAEHRRAGAASPHAAGDGAVAGLMPPASDLAQALARAPEIAERRGHPAAFDADDLFLAMLEDRGARATELLRGAFGVTREDAAATLGQAGEPPAEAIPEPPEEGAPVGLGGAVREIDARTAELEARVRALEGRLRILFIVILIILAGLATMVLSTSPTVHGVARVVREPR